MRAMTSCDSGKKDRVRRDSSIELFRIILMLLIIAHHYVVNSPLLGEGLHAGGERLFCLRNLFL